jgi:hypothetical protein
MAISRYQISNKMYDIEIEISYLSGTYFDFSYICKRSFSCDLITFESLREADMVRH